MKSVGLRYSDHTLLEREIPSPVIEREGDVLFRVREVGICGTDRDLASFRLSFPQCREDFLVLGHECVGEVLQVGSAVTAIRPGDIVVPLVRRPCAPPCHWCAAGRRDMCASGEYTERGIKGANGYFTEFAVDSEEDLVSIPISLVHYAVLAEPLSVVEKAIKNAFRLHPGAPQDALVLGAGAIGLLAGMALRERGLNVTICSLEPVNSARARMVSDAGINYVNQARGVFDLVLEAAGAAEAAVGALAVLAPAGVLVVLGANRPVEIPMLQLILKNQVVAGSVNAAPSDFLSAVEDLAKFPTFVLDRMIAREPWGTYRETLTGPLRSTPKIVHVLE